MPIDNRSEIHSVIQAISVRSARPLVMHPRDGRCRPRTPLRHADTLRGDRCGRAHRSVIVCAELERSAPRSCCDLAAIERTLVLRYRAGLGASLRPLPARSHRCAAKRYRADARSGHRGISGRTTAARSVADAQRDQVAEPITGYLGVAGYLGVRGADAAIEIQICGNIGRCLTC
jgi:hypothetical protein